MDCRGRRWSVSSAGVPANLSTVISPPVFDRLPSSWPNSPESDNSVFDSRFQVPAWPKLKSRSNSIGELFNRSWIRSNSTSDEPLRLKSPRFSLSMFQGSSKSIQKTGFGIITLLNGNTILIFSQYSSELSYFLAKAETDQRICDYKFVSANVQTAQTLDFSKGIIGPTLERIIEQYSEDGTLNDEITKKEIWQELLRDENVYYKSLKNLYQVYATPIRNFSYLNPEEHQNMFSGIETLISLSSALISQIELFLSNWDPSNSNTGCIFPSQIWTHYNDYYCKYPGIKTFMEQKFQEECPFTVFCEESKIGSGQSLQDLIYLPCQRIPEYEQYLSNLLEKAEENQTDYQSYKEAIEQIKNILCGSFKNGIEQTENNNNNHYPNSPVQLGKDKITEPVQRRRKSSTGAILFKNLGTAKTRFSWMSGDKGLDHDIANFARYQSNIRRLYITEMAVQLTNSVQTHDRYLFLFDDILLVAKQKSNNNFKLKYYVRICEMWLATCLDEISELNNDKEKSFVIGWPTLSYVATFPSNNLKEKWQTKLRQLIDEKKEHEEPKEIQVTIQNTDQKQIITMPVQNTTMAKEVFQKCLDEFQISKSDSEDYELRTGYGDNDSTPHLLIGHEIPFNIKMNRIRNNSDNKDDCDINDSKAKYDFLLMASKKSPKKQTPDDIEWKGLKKKRHHFNLFKKTTKLEEKPLKRLFGLPLKDVSVNDNPPKPIEDLLELLLKKGPSIRGIFRTPANAKKKREFCEMLNNEEATNMSEVTGNLAAAVLMEYLRSVPRGLLMEHKYLDWIESGRILNDTEKLAKIQSLVNDLPLCNRRLLQQLMCVFYCIDKRSSENLMSAQNLATCIAPSLLGSKQLDCQDDLILLTDVITYMIENCVQIFGSDVIYIPPERNQDDSDTDSFHSILSTPDTGGLIQSDNSSTQSLDREFGNVETECTNSCLSPSLQKTFDSHLEPDYPQMVGMNAYNKITTRKRDDSQESEESTSSLASNNSTCPVPPPRRNRQNIITKHKSMTSINTTLPLPNRKDNSSQSESDLLNCTSDLSVDSYRSPGCNDKNLRSVHANKKTLNSQILTTVTPPPTYSTRIFRQKRLEQESFIDEIQIPHNYNHKETLEITPCTVRKNNRERIPNSKSMGELNQQEVYQRPPQHPSQQQRRKENGTRAHYSDRKQLLPAPENLIKETDTIQTEKEVRLALVQDRLGPPPVENYFEEEPFLKMSNNNLKLSPPPSVLLQNIKQTPIALKIGEDNRKHTSKTVRMVPVEEFGSRFSNSKQSTGNGRVPVHYTGQGFPEKHPPFRYALNMNREEKHYSTPSLSQPINSVVTHRKPKNPPSYEEAMTQKLRQHQRSSYAEKLYQESLKDFSETSNENYITKTSTSVLAKHYDPNFGKNIVVNNAISRKVVLGQCQDNSAKIRRRSAPPGSLVPENRLHSVSISETNLNSTCNSNGSKTVKNPQVCCKSKAGTANDADFSMHEKTHKITEKTRVLKPEPCKIYRTSSNANSVTHKPLTKTHSMDLGPNQKRKVSKNNPVLPWSVSKMINKFATKSDTPPRPHNQFK